MEGDRLLVRQRQDELAAVAVLRAGRSRGCSRGPVSCQSSSGVRTGMSISCAPIASISSRMICTTF